MDPLFEVTPEETESVLRRASSLSAAHSEGLDDLDLRQSYRDAIDCVFKCESIIVNLERQLKVKDERIAELETAAGSGRMAREQLDAKDERIAGLEAKLVSMSLELAVTKAREGELQLKLAQSNGNLSSSSASTQNLATAGFHYKPVSKGGRRRRWGIGRERDDEGSGENKESFNTDATAESTDASARNEKNHDNVEVKIDDSFTTAEGDSSPDESATSRGSLTNGLGHFLDRMAAAGRRKEGDVQVDFPLAAHDEDRPEEDEETGPSARRSWLRRTSNAEPARPAPPVARVQEPVRSQPALEQPCRQPHEPSRPEHNDVRSGVPVRQRRAPNRRRLAHQKSSRSFLEPHGVVFPVSSFEVLDKGCITASMIKKRETNGKGGGSNEEWPAFG